MEKAKQIPYRAIALDLDGTLTNHEKVVKIGRAHV